MIERRPAAERGHADHGWLDARHSFSFAGYYDPKHMGFGPLRVLNEDRIERGAGFPMHPHHDMEILTYVISGSLEHRDSMGNGGVIRAGEFQRMSAGRGIRHSEFNPSKIEPLHLLQIWIEPYRRGHLPEYEQRELADADRRNRLALVAAPPGEEGALRLYQDARVYSALLDAGREVDLDLAPGRRAWIQVAGGAVRVGGQTLAAGDGAAVSGEPKLEITATEDADLLVFDLP